MRTLQIQVFLKESLEPSPPRTVIPLIRKHVTEVMGEKIGKKTVKEMIIKKILEINLKHFKNCEPKVEEPSRADQPVSDVASQSSKSSMYSKKRIPDKPKVEELSRADLSVSDVASQSCKSYTESTTIINLLEMTESSALDQSMSKVALNSITDHERSPKMSCILFSRLFGANFEFDKDFMVQLSVAQGIFEPENEEIMEIVGSTIFDSMVEDNLFVPVRFDNLYGQLFAVNENMLDSNLFEGEEQLPMEDFMLADEVGLVSIPSTIKHLSLFRENFDLHTVEVLKSFTGMQTLMLHCECATGFNHVSHDLFLHLKRLRTLDLHQLDITELPSSVGDLEYLHYLDVSETSIKYLPETVDSLYLLQTLKLKGCLQLCRLPKNTRRLVRLCHLDLDIIRQLKSMPIGLGSLTSLQTLSGFLVGKKDGCYIGELKNLVNLRGSLCISRLENISSPDKAEQANLSNKKHITKLQLQWSTLSL
ncbi:unnamed protein product [Coffea canephora]|uniref:Disease resistance R13L4/SHOC-2-like LRR domain-containing protein n=1 Tax=Coffea canephora TaxID=49390 RepID=A0A068VBY7_COFCA|nr:unnamed protein product [Coffea canephora]